MPPPDASSSGWACTAIKVRGSAIPTSLPCLAGCAVRPAQPALRCPDDQGARLHRHGEGPVRRDELPVHFAGERGVRGDLHRARLESRQVPVLVPAVRQHAGGDLRPAERAVRREDPDVEQPVVDAGVGQQREPAGQQPGVADDHRPRVALDRRPAVHADREPGRRQREVDRPGHRVGEPAEVMLEPGRRHDRRVEAHARHRGERRPVGSGQVDPAVRAAGAAGAQDDGERGPGVRRDAQRRGEQVAGADRDDPERDARVREAFGASPYGPVAADGDNKVGAVGRGVPGGGDAGFGLAGDVEFRSPPGARGGRMAQRQEPPAGLSQRAVDHERDGSHNFVEATHEMPLRTPAGHLRVRWAMMRDLGRSAT